MQLIRNLDAIPADLQGGAVTIGNFDGVHRGHARIVERLRARAREAGGPAIVFTFDPHPVRLLRPDAAPPPLTWTDRKAELLASLGVDAMVVYPTDEALLALSPQAFFDLVVVRRLAARAMVEGPNFFFGRGRAGDVRLLGTLCSQAGVVLEVVEPLVAPLSSQSQDTTQDKAPASPPAAERQFVSSSRVRGLIQQGDLQEAGRLLTQPYRIRGMVTHGAGRGGKIGFPTANVAAIDTLLPGVGVYAGRALTSRGVWPAAINVGANPTFGEHALKVEVHLIDFHGSLYGEAIEVDFLGRLRDIQPFASIEALQAQLIQDVESARRVASGAVSSTESTY